MDQKQLEYKVLTLEKRITSLERRGDTVENEIDKIRREVEHQCRAPLDERVRAIEAKLAIQDDISSKVKKLTQDIAAMRE